LVLGGNKAILNQQAERELAGFFQFSIIAFTAQQNLQYSLMGYQNSGV